MAFEISGKTFLVTGGASGLGALYVQAFLNEGAKHVAIFDIKEEEGQAFANKMNDTFGAEKVLFLRCDVSDTGASEEAFNDVIGRVGQLDVLVNNAGVMDDSPGGWANANKLNYEGLVNLTLLALGHMRVDKGAAGAGAGAGGTIVNVSSIAGLLPHPCFAIYSGTKSAVLHFTRCLGFDAIYQQSKVRMLVFCPGPTETPLLEDLQKKALDDYGYELLKPYLTPNKRPELLSEGMVEMLKLGDNASIWLVNNDKPLKEITSIVEEAYNMLFNALF